MIETERLLLRPHTLKDFDDMLAVSSDVGVMRFLARNVPSTANEAWTRLLRNIGHWSALNYGQFAVIEKQSGLYAGDTGLADFRRELGDDFDLHPEAAWVFAGRVHGKGYATEAARAVHEWFDRTRGRMRTVCIVHPENAASINVARKLGYAAYGEAIYKDDRVIKFERLP